MKKEYRLLIGFDGSDCSKAAITGLPRAGLPKKVTAIVLTVADVYLPAGPDRIDQNAQWLVDVIQRARARSRQALHQAARLSRGAARRLRHFFPKWNVKAEAAADTPAWGIIKRADRWKPDLLMVGCRGHSRWDQVMLGSVSHQVLTEAGRSVRIVPDITRKRMTPPRLLIGFDGSRGAQSAVDVVRRRHWPKRTSVRLVAVLDIKMKAGMAAISPGIENAMQAAVNRLTDVGLQVDSRIIHGDPKRILVQEAKKWRADTLFVGARGLSAMDRFLTGSVSRAVASNAPCAVEVIRKEKLSGRSE